MQITRKIWVNGVFDVLHRGHIELFNFAKNQGGYLTVGIDADKRVKERVDQSITKQIENIF